VLVEPAINPIWTLLLLGERPGPLTIVGGLLIVSSTLAHAVVRPRTAAADAAAVTPD
jgi:drug/metabolite transporter (DMT)-like permease